jgi:RNA polymerase sigma factor (sigma-70 family)
VVPVFGRRAPSHARAATRDAKETSVQREERAVEYLEGVTASPFPHPEFECDRDAAAAAASATATPPGKRDFLASLNQGVGRELLDAYVENRTDDNRNALAMHYGLCAQVVARQVYRALTPDARRQVELGDAEQTAMALLFQLVEKFDVSLGIPLSAFLTRRLRYAMIDEYRRSGLMMRGAGAAAAADRLRRVPLERDGRALAVVDGRPGPAEEAAEREAEWTLLREVPSEHRAFVVFRFLRGMQLWQVAKRLNITCERAGEVQAQCVAILRRAMGATEPAAPECACASRTAAPVKKEERPARGAAKRGVGELLPVDLRRAKEFRRWCVRRVPWAYRKLVAYRYLRGRDIEWTAARLGICPDKARVLDRQARPIVMRVVEEYRGGLVTAAVA